MVQQYIQPDPPASKPRPPTPRKNKPKSAKDEKWIGGGPAPAEGSRVIQILYLLSEEGQREAFLSTKSMPGGDVWSLPCARLQKRAITYTSEYFEMAFRLCWIDPEGRAYCFVGGKDAFEQKRSEDGFEWLDIWKPTDKYVDSLFRCKVVNGGYTDFHGEPIYAKKYGIDQTAAPPLCFDDPTLEIYELLEAEEERQFEIDKSKRAAEQKADKLTAEAEEKFQEERRERHENQAKGPVSGKYTVPIEERSF